MLVAWRKIIHVCVEKNAVGLGRIQLGGGYCLIILFIRNSDNRYNSFKNNNSKGFTNKCVKHSQSH